MALGELTLVDQKLLPSATSGPFLNSIGIDTVEKIIIGMYNKVTFTLVSWTYDNNGNLTEADSISISDESTSATYGHQVTLDVSKKLIFLTMRDLFKVYSYDAAGSLTYVTTIYPVEVVGSKFCMSVIIDTVNQMLLIVLFGGDAVYSYSNDGSILTPINHGIVWTGPALRSSMQWDSTRRIVFALETAGDMVTNTFNATTGHLTLRDWDNGFPYSGPQGMEAISMDTTKRLIFVANGSRLDRYNYLDTGSNAVSYLGESATTGNRDWSTALDTQNRLLFEGGESFRTRSYDASGDVSDYLDTYNIVGPDLGVTSIALDVGRNLAFIATSVTGYYSPSDTVSSQQSELTSFSYNPFSSSLTLVSNGENNNSIENSIVIINSDSDIEFSTNDAPAEDQVHNLMTYNYGDGSLDIANLPSNIFASLPNVDPLFTEATLSSGDFDIYDVMDKAFLPLNSSPVVDAGDNQFVADIPGDIIGDERIYISGIVDVGPYELKLHQLLFTSDMIKSIFQDKLRIDYDNKRFLPVITDDIYTDLWDQFVENPDHKEEFIREAKVIIKMKSLTTDVQYSIDKKNIELARYEAYFDLKSKSIVLSKTDEFLGSMLNSVFDDGRYVFSFSELEHIFIVYINPTYKMGKSGKSNIVNEVRAGGPAVTSR